MDLAGRRGCAGVSDGSPRAVESTSLRVPRMDQEMNRDYWR